MIRKAIAEKRDWLQSRWLLGVAAPVLVLLIWTAATQAVTDGDGLVAALAISVVFALAAWRLRAATPAGAGFGGAICFLVTISTKMPGTSSPSRTGLTPLVLLFVLTFLATRAGRARKVRAGLAESRKGRNAAQVVANLGVAAVACSVASTMSLADRHGMSESVQLAGAISMVAALVEATADTVSSEVGQAFGGTPVSVLTLRRVPPGTDGAISWAGTLAGVAAGAMVALAGALSLGLRLRETAIAFAAGTMGLFLDSVLGGTVEARGWLGNDLVNLASTSGAAWLAWMLARR